MGKASCMKSCDSFNDATRHWSCAAIGPRNTHMYEAGAFAPGLLEVAPPLKQCARIGESCAATKCCVESGYNCYEKNSTWASCLMNCIPNKPNGGIANMPIIKTAQSMKTSVFACDFWNVFSDMSVQLNPGHTIKVDYTKVHYSNGTAVRRPNTQIFVNTPLFVNVWTHIKHQDTWRSFSWVVKADPFTVFIPSRLRSILSQQLVTPTGVYTENCKYVRMSLHG